VAVDNAGRMIVLSEAVAYDLGEKISGRLHLDLVYREVKIQESKTPENNLPAFMQDEYIIVARSEPLEAPHVEIARIHRDQPHATIQDAADPSAPGINAIDLRYRMVVCPPPVEQVLAGVCLLSQGSSLPYAQALNNLSAPLASAAPYHLIVEDQVPLQKGVFDFALLYLIADAQTRFSPAQAELLQAYVQNGGKVLAEFCEPVGDEVPAALFKSAGIPLAKIPAAHPIYRAPHLFIHAPQGSMPKASGSHSYGNPGVLCSTAGYGVIWSGAVQQPEFTREVVRSAVEWGVNLLTFLLAH
jgi:hypothetical protein